MDELITALNEMDNDPKIGAIVVTGSEKVNIICTTSIQTAALGLELDIFCIIETVGIFILNLIFAHFN